MKKLHKHSWHFYVGIVIGLCMAACGVYCVYDCMTDAGFWPGVYGVLTFVIVEPVLLLLLGLDILCWFLYKNKIEKRKQEDEML